MQVEDSERKKWHPITPRRTSADSEVPDADSSTAPTSVGAACEKFSCTRMRFYRCQCPGPTVPALLIYTDAPTDSFTSPPQGRCAFNLCQCECEYDCLKDSEGSTYGTACHAVKCLSRQSRAPLHWLALGLCQFVSAQNVRRVTSTAVHRRLNTARTRTFRQTKCWRSCVTRRFGLRCSPSMNG